MSDETTTTTDRDERNGRFLPGNSGFGGRPKGSRNKLGEKFVEDLLVDWQQHGAEVIEAVRAADPATYLRVVAGILPKQIEADLSVIAHAESFAQAFELAVQAIGADRPPRISRRRLLELEAGRP